MSHHQLSPHLSALFTWCTKIDSQTWALVFLSQYCLQHVIFPFVCSCLFKGYGPAHLPPCLAILSAAFCHPRRLLFLLTELFSYRRSQSIFLEFGVSQFHRVLGLCRGVSKGDFREVSGIERIMDTLFLSMEKFWNGVLLAEYFSLTSCNIWESRLETRIYGGGGGGGDGEKGHLGSWLFFVSKWTVQFDEGKKKKRQPKPVLPLLFLSCSLATCCFCCSLWKWPSLVQCIPGHVQHKSGFMWCFRMALCGQDTGCVGAGGVLPHSMLAGCGPLTGHTGMLTQHVGAVCTHLCWHLWVFSSLILWVFCRKGLQSMFSKKAFLLTILWWKVVFNQRSQPSLIHRLQLWAIRYFKHGETAIFC